MTHFPRAILFGKAGNCPMSAIATRRPESSQSGFHQVATFGTSGIGGKQTVSCWVALACKQPLFQTSG
jgi:hypothetical protein